MAIHPKTRRRVTILVLIFVVTCAALVTLYLGIQYRRDRNALEHRHTGLEAFEAKNYDQALELLPKFIRQHGDDAEVLYALAQSRLNVEVPRSQHVIGAIGILRRLLAANPKHETARHELLALYQRVGYNTEALRTAETILEQDSDDLKALRAKTVAQVRLAKYPEALDVLMRLLALDEFDIEMQLLALSLRRQLDEPASVLIEQAEALQGDHPEDPGFELLLGHAHRLNDDHEKTVKWLTAAAARTPTDETFAFLLIRSLDQAQLFRDSLSLLERMTEQFDNAVLHDELIRRLWEVNRFQEVADRLNDLDETEASASVEMLVLRAMASAHLGDPDTANEIATALRKREQDPHAAAWADVLHAAGGAGAGRPSATRVVEIAQSAVEQYPDSAYLHDYLAEAYHHVGETRQALSAWQRAIALRPIWPRPHIRRSQMLLTTGDTKAALLEAQIAAKLAPQNADAIVTWVYARAANLDGDTDDSVDAVLADIDKFRKLVPAEEQTLRLKISMLARHGRKQEAIETLQAALAQNRPISESALYQLAAVSRTFELNMEESCYALSTRLYGITPNVALANATDLARNGHPEDGWKLITSAHAESREGDRLEWQLAIARFADIVRSPDAAGRWIKLADTYPDNLHVQKMVLDALSVQSDRQFVDRIIDRVRKMAGEKSVNWRLKRAAWLLQSNNIDNDTANAASILEPVITESPDLLEARLLMARAMERINHLDRAIDELKAAAQLRPDTMAIKLDMARLYQRLRQWDSARQHLQHVANNEQANPQQLRHAAAMMARQGDVEPAIRILENLQTSNDWHPQKHGLVLAQLYRQDMQYDKADKLCRELLEAPTASIIRFVADYNDFRGRPKEAGQVLARLDGMELAPGVRESIRADHYRKYRGVTEATAHYRAAVQAMPQNTRLWERLIVFYLSAGQIDAALAAADEAVEVVDDSEPIAFFRKQAALVRAYGAAERHRPILIALATASADREIAAEVMQAQADLDAGKTTKDELVNRLGKLANDNPDFLSLQSIAVRSYLQADRRSEAVNLARRAASRFPTSAELARLAAKTLMMAKQWDQAMIAAYDWRRRAQPRTTEADLMISELALRLGKPQVGTSQLRPHIDLALRNPDANAIIIIQYARTLIVDGRTEQAAQLLAPLLERSGNWRIAWVRLATMAINNPHQSKAWLKRVEPMVPDGAVNERAVLAQGWRTIAARNGDAKAMAIGRDLLDEVVALPNATAEAWFLHGTIVEQDGDLKQAEQSYRAALKLSPGMDEAWNNLAMVLIARGGDQAEALKLARQAVQAAPQNPNYLDTLSQVLVKAGDLDAAIINIRKAVELQPNNPQWQKHLSVILAAAGQREEAARILENLEKDDVDDGQTIGDAVSSMKR